uniref:Uncharacterized protein n=1 Tax=Panagrolaimus sp. ES5 TaxID=591445 RepID=A0AC34GB89_9BILA
MSNRRNKNKESDKAEQENDASQSRLQAGTKRKSFQALFGTNDQTSTKIRKLNEKLHLSDFKCLLSKSIEEQRKERIVLMLTDPDKLRAIDVSEKTLNFGLCDINGTTIEAVVFGRSDQLRLKSLLNASSNEENVIVLKGWSWYINNSTFITSTMIQDKINIGFATQINFVSRSELVSSTLNVFKLCDSLERLIISRCFKIHETTWFMVAKQPKYFYQTYSGVLISDGQFFGIIAAKMDASGGLITEFEFKADTVFKMKNVDAKIFDVAHRKIGESELDYLQLNNVQKPCIFYVDEKTEIIEGVYEDMDFVKELTDIDFPEHAEEVPKTRLTELIKSLKSK